VLRTTWRPLVGSIVSAGIAFFFRQTLLPPQPRFSSMVLAAGVYLLSYGALVVGLFGVRRPVWAALTLCRDLLPAYVSDSFKTTMSMKVEETPIMDAAGRAAPVTPANHGGAGREHVRPTSLLNG
jgi:hypothetical protein